jgi:hypothetical protein
MIYSFQVEISLCGQHAVCFDCRQSTNHKPLNINTYKKQFSQDAKPNVFVLKSRFSHRPAVPSDGGVGQDSGLLRAEAAGDRVEDTVAAELPPGAVAAGRVHRFGWPVAAGDLVPGLQRNAARGARADGLEYAAQAHHRLPIRRRRLPRGVALPGRVAPTLSPPATHHHSLQQPRLPCHAAGGSCEYYTCPGEFELRVQFCFFSGTSG